MSGNEFWGRSEVVKAYAEERPLMKAEAIFLQQYLRPSMRVLDIGCGTGRVSIHLEKDAKYLKGIDIDETMLVEYRRRIPSADTECCAMQEMNEPSNFYDMVLIPYNGIDYLEPKESRIKSLDKVLGCLKPGGVLIFSSHNPLADFCGWLRCANLGTLRSIIERFFLGYSFRSECYVPERLFGTRVPTYYGRDSVVINDVKSVGFDLLEVRGAELGSGNPLFYRWFEFWIYYAFQKPC